ncbi:GAF and ANTAR domain-containing protein [Nocardioides aquiterrae]|uniref:GAF and ANTAR domain-containing protein n=1 Tax=Nocardioides aquiterrae TaxID=203799 RepID=A0ABP4F994_9ACTN
MTDEQRLAARFAELSGDLLGESDVGTTFDSVVTRAVEMVPGCTHATITLRKRRGTAETVAATDEMVERLDGVQYDFGEGPCLDAAFDRGNVVVDDTAAGTRWPRWSAEACVQGVGSLMAIRLHAGDETLGALNLFAETPGTFSGESGDVALIYAAHATEAMSKARLVAGLRAALESRHIIGIAQGVLAARYDISYERAFEVLHRYSNDHNLKLRDVAETVASERGLPPGRSPDVTA